MNSKALAETIVLGGDGLIGSAYLARAQNQGHVIPWTSRRGQPGSLFLDLEQPLPLPWHDWKQAGYRYVLITAALTSLAACEQDPERSFLLNVTRPLQLATLAHEYGLVPILFSTDYVFDGQQGNYREQDPVNPLNVYGRHKTLLEQSIRQLEQAMILRLTKVYTSRLNDQSLLASMAEPLRQGHRIRAAEDMIFAPVSIEDVLNTLTWLQTHDFRGLIHLGGNEVWSRYDLTVFLAQQFKYPANLIQRITMADLAEPFARPRQTDLNIDFLQKMTSQRFQSLSAAIRTLATGD